MFFFVFNSQSLTIVVSVIDPKLLMKILQVTFTGGPKGEEKKIHTLFPKDGIYDITLVSTLKNTYYIVRLLRLLINASSFFITFFLSSCSDYSGECYTYSLTVMPSPVLILSSLALTGRQSICSFHLLPQL